VSRWSEVVAAAPELAASVRDRFDAHGLALLATVRRDGSPRLSGLEPLFTPGDLWFGMMSQSRKGADLRRDGRFALHSATTDKQVAAGDAKLSGRAGPVTDEAHKAAFRRDFERATGAPPPEGPFELFRADVSEMSLLRPAGDHLDIWWWRDGVGEHRVERY
jgi:Pyridoxamine 5'-phosphate oxidase